MKHKNATFDRLKISQALCLILYKDNIYIYEYVSERPCLEKRKKK